MSDIKVVSYGSWQSPISSDLIVAESVRLSDIVLDGRDTYWVEMRPSEGGRNVIVRCTSDGQMADITPPDFVALAKAFGARGLLVDDLSNVGEALASVLDADGPVLLEIPNEFGHPGYGSFGTYA